MGMSNEAAKKPVTWEMYEEACAAARGALDENETLIKENRSLRDYIHWKGLDEEFERFHTDAREDADSELPFPRLVISTEK